MNPPPNPPPPDPQPPILPDPLDHTTQPQSVQIRGFRVRQSTGYPISEQGLNEPTFPLWQGDTPFIRAYNPLPQANSDLEIDLQENHLDPQWLRGARMVEPTAEWWINRIADTLGQFRGSIRFPNNVVHEWHMGSY